MPRSSPVKTFTDSCHSFTNSKVAGSFITVAQDYDPFLLSLLCNNLHHLLFFIHQLIVNHLYLACSFLIILFLSLSLQSCCFGCDILDGKIQNFNIVSSLLSPFYTCQWEFGIRFPPLIPSFINYSIHLCGFDALYY